MIVGVPCINRPDLLERFFHSIDALAFWVVVDNSGAGNFEIEDVCNDHVGVFRIAPVVNLGVAASWNLIIRSFPARPFWIIANADTVLGPGDLERLALEMQRPGPRWVGMNGDWRVFAINAECVERVGFFDENFYPIYCEDADYERRCTLVGVPWYSIDGDATHDGSATIRSGYGEANARTYPANVAYFEAKWGGPVREGRFLTPFDRCGSVADWSLQLARLRDLAWEPA